MQRCELHEVKPGTLLPVKYTTENPAKGRGGSAGHQGFFLFNREGFGEIFIDGLKQAEFHQPGGTSIDAYRLNLKEGQNHSLVVSVRTNEVRCFFTTLVFSD